MRANFLRSGRNVSCGCWVPRKTAKHPTGAAHHNWKGEKVGYHALHVWINRKKDKTGFCSICGAERYTEWGNVSEDRSYSRNLGDYIEVCKPCHLDLDGHPWKRSAKLKETQ